MSHRWHPVQSIPPLPEGEVQVWLDSLTDHALPRLDIGVLSPAESAQAARFVLPARRDAFIRGRLLLRHLLAHHLGIPAARVLIGLHPGGKPFLAGDAPTPVAFSIAHSAGIVLVAVSRAGEVGVDVEPIDRVVDQGPVIRRFFAPAEAEAIAGDPPDQRTLAFFRCWTRKEALLKALGDGLARPLADVVVPTGPMDAVAITLPGDDTPWHLHDLAVDTPYVAALAARTKPAAVRTLRLVS